MLTADKYDEDLSQYISESAFSYNGLGKVTLATEEILDSSTDYHIKYIYDQAGYLTGVSYPSTSSTDPNTIEIVREKLGRIGSIRQPGGSNLVDYEYIGSRVKQRSYPNVGSGIDYDMTYNDLGQATRRYTHETATAIADFNYTFDDNGNITGQEFAHRTSTPDNQYTYDDIDRLIEADYLVGVLTEDEQFTYDKLGNRESVNLRDGSDQDYVVNYSTNRYDNDAGEDIVCDYDDAGNTTEDPNGYQYIYDYENRLTLISHQVLSPHSWCDVRQHLIMESFILIYYNLF